MPNTLREAPSGRSRVRLIVACSVLFLFAGTLAAAIAVPRLLQSAAKADDGATGLVTQREGDLQYTFHLVTGHEALFDLRKDPRLLKNLARERPEDLERLRLILMRDLGVTDLEVLRAPHQDDIDRLKALGYL